MPATAWASHNKGTVAIAAVAALSCAAPRPILLEALDPTCEEEWASGWVQEKGKVKGLKAAHHCLKCEKNRADTVKAIHVIAALFSWQRWGGGGRVF